jgi:hypothetical protein
VPATWHIESFIDTLPLTNQRGLRSVGSLRLAILLVNKGFHKWHEVATGGIHVAFMWQQVAPGGSADRIRYAPRSV